MSQDRLGPILVSFSGMDGSGKSTQIENLCARLISAGLTVSRVTFWDDVVGLSKWRAGFSHKFLKSTGEIGEPGKPARRNDKNNRAWYLLLARSALYVLDAWNLRAAVFKARRRNASVVVFDRYIYDQLATLPINSVTKSYARLALHIRPSRILHSCLTPSLKQRASASLNIPLIFSTNTVLPILRCQSWQACDWSPPDRWNRYKT